MGKTDRRFILGWTTRDTKEFRNFAEQAKRLSPHGRPLVDISAMADKAFHIIPEGGSAWHEYSANWPTLHRFFPHPKVAPHLPADWIRANRELLLAKAAILREMKLGASFHGNDPHFWPESFWREHPHLRGPRIDHPRRSRKEEFAICTDLEEGRAMIAWELTEFKRNVPELEAFIFNTNDAGSGFCWAAAQYAGSNGPRHCMGITAGERVRKFHEALHGAARAAGGDISIWMDHANFWRNEINEVVPLLPGNSAVIWRDPTSLVVPLSEYMGSAVRGLVDPLGVFRGMEAFDDPRVKNVFLRFGTPTHRGAMSLDAIEKVLDLVIDCIERPAKGTRARLERLHRFCVKWAGEKNAETLLEGFVRLDEALHAVSLVAPRFNPIHAAVSMRHLTRPLVIKPELLTGEEESYFLPYVFNTRENEARTDYIDLHGIRMVVGTGDSLGIPGLSDALAGLRAAAGVLEGMNDAPAGKWLRDVGTSIRIYAAMIRSIDNFYFGQKIRDRHAAELSRVEPVNPEKKSSWDGEGEILAWNERMRDELDNATELLALLEERGIDQVYHAQDNRHQSPFIFGPDIIGDLKKKVRIMRDHWLDVERYLAPPSK